MLETVSKTLRFKLMFKNTFLMLNCVYSTEVLGKHGHSITRGTGEISSVTHPCRTLIPTGGSLSVKDVEGDGEGGGGRRGGGEKGH